VALGDWQGILRGKGAHDVAYYLTQSMPVEARRAHERELVGRWHAELVDAGVDDYGPDRAWEDYRRAALYLWTYVVVITGADDPPLLGRDRRPRSAGAAGGVLLAPLRPAGSGDVDRERLDPRAAGRDRPAADREVLAPRQVA
jgi:hypothetical protein